ncbi:MAG: cupin domain-containing protein [Proteobacteria bacterium]|nr:cupin domain-containing protein [Pseudomonadota bacterium]
MKDDVSLVKRLLSLKRHSEGGHYREVFRDNLSETSRAHSTAIYFLLTRGEISRWHRVDAAEVWHWYRGAPLELLIGGEDGKPARHVLGNRIEKGERPQIVVPGGVWQRAKSLGRYTLAGCTVAPGFEFSGFELAPEELLFSLNLSAPAKPSPKRARSRAKTRGRYSPSRR